MSRGINQVTLIGNACADPEQRYMPSGESVVNLRVATSESWRDKSTGERKERSEYHSCVFFGKVGEICAEFVRKGNQVYIQGQLRTRKYQGKDGGDRYSTEIVVNQLQMLGSRNERDASSPPAAPRPSAHDDSFDDDIPFN